MPNPDPVDINPGEVNPDPQEVEAATPNVNAIKDVDAVKDVDALEDVDTIIPQEEPSLGDLYLKYYAEALERHTAKT